MRLWAGVALLCLMVAGCAHLPDDVRIDLGNRVVTVGSCQCRLPGPEAVAPEAAVDPQPAPAPDEPRR